MSARRRDRSGDERTDEERIEGIRRLKADLAIASKPELTALADQLYKHVLDCIDFDALFQLEQVSWGVLHQMGLSALDDDLGISGSLISRALIIAAHDPSRCISDVPHGITKAEACAARFDASCPFCRYEDELRRERAEPAAHDHAEEACPMCDDMARAWRTEHADQLRRAGLLPGEAS